MLALMRCKKKVRDCVALAHSQTQEHLADLVFSSSTGFIGGAGNYPGAGLGAGGYGAGNVVQRRRSNSPC